MIRLHVKISPWQWLLTLATHSLAAAAIIAAALTPVLRGFLLLAIAASCCRHCRRLLGSWPRRLEALYIGSSFSRLCFADGECRAALPRAEYISEHLIVLSVLPENRRRPIILSLWPGSLHRHEDWQLRSWLRSRT